MQQKRQSEYTLYVVIPMLSMTFFFFLINIPSIHIETPFVVVEILLQLFRPKNLFLFRPRNLFFQNEKALNSLPLN